MKIILCSSFVPFSQDRCVKIINCLEEKLQKTGNQVERVTLPYIEEPELSIQQKIAFRWVDLENTDMIICFGLAANYVAHKNKIVWLIESSTARSNFHNKDDSETVDNFCDISSKYDAKIIKEARTIFCTSKQQQMLLKNLYKIDSEILYIDDLSPEVYYNNGYSQEIICMDPPEISNRQYLLIDAMASTLSPIHLRILATESSEYLASLSSLIDKLNLKNKVTIDVCIANDKMRIEKLSTSLALANFSNDPNLGIATSIQASYAGKPTLTISDCKGVSEIVRHNVSGYISESHPKAIATALDKLYFMLEKTKQMGSNAKKRLEELNISWNYILQRLLNEDPNC